MQTAPTSTDLGTGKKQQVGINERQIVFWSKKYQERTHYERARAIEQAAPYSTCENTYGANRYFKNVVVNNIDGEGIEHKEYVRT